MKLGSESRSVFGGTDLWKKSEWALSLLSLVTSCFTVSVVPFLRKDFGERYLGWINLFFGYTIVANFTFLGSIIMVLFRRGGSSRLMLVFWVAFILASLWHLREIHRKNKKGEQWHSMYMGTSILPLPFSREFIYKFAEPALVFLAGRMLWDISGQVGLWLMIAAVSLFVNNHIIYHNQRQAILDLRDSEIEARNIGKAFAGRPASETCGLVVAESNIDLIRKDAGLQEAFSNLSPELKSVLDAQPGAQAAPESTR